MIKEIRCSQLHRPMNCLGFLFLANVQETEAGQPAKDGTACGELLSEMIRQRTPNPTFGPYASNGVFLDQDMWFHARNTYEDVLASANGAPIETEERIDWMTKAGVLIRGQFDISFVKGSTLHVEDLKYGWGIVDVEKNWQLIGYAIGQALRIYKTRGVMVQEFVFKIHQPRPYHPDGRVREWRITYNELEVYWKQIEDRMLEYVNGNKTLTTGKSCKYCEGVNTCPAMNRSLYKSVETVMTDWQDKVMSNEDVAFELDLLSRVSELLKIKQDSLNQLATMRLQANQVIPGYAFEMDYGDRKWRENVTVKSILAMTGKDITKVDMLSPNQAERLGVSKKLTAQLTERAAKGTKLVKKNVVKEAEKIFKKPF